MTRPERLLLIALIASRVGADRRPDRAGRGPADRLRPAPPVVHAGAHVVVLGGLFVTTVFVAFVGDELFPGSAAAVTAFSLVLSASRLRR